MGKKSKRQAGGASVQRPQAGAVMNNRAVCRAVNELWERTQGAVTDSLPSLWQEYEFVTSMTKVIKEKQGPTQLPLPERREKFEAFEKWLAEYGAVYADQVEIAEYPGCGFGLRAKKDMKMEEKVMVIPDKLMMNSLTARDGLLGKLIAQDRILQMMHNVALSLHLLNERYAAEDSFWKPYIDILPHSFFTPFYFTKAELQLLQGSPTLVKSLQQIRNVAKLFAHLHRLIRSHGDPALPLYKVGFYFNDFVWAVSSVMSRQNEIPLGITPGTTLALIPLWDMANHTQGPMTTFFDVKNRMCECFAVEDVKAGEEFKIFYGARNNSDLFVHQGFVYSENQHDYVPIKLGLSSAESSKTRALKERLLSEAELTMPGTFKLLAAGDPFPHELRFVVRIFTACQEQLEQFFDKEGKLVGVGRLLRPWNPYDDRAVDFLEKRCQLLLQAYKTTIDEDTALLSGGGAKQLSPCSSVAIKIRQSEKKVLHNAVLFARTLKESLLNQPIEDEDEEYSVNGSAHEMTQPTGNLGGAADDEPVVLEIDSEGGVREAKQPTGNMAGATDSVPVVVDIGDNGVLSDRNGDETEMQQTTVNLAGAAKNVPVVVNTKNEVSSETNVHTKPGEIVKNEQVNGAVDDNELPELSDESKEKCKEGEKSSEEGGRERDESEGVKGCGGGKVEGQGGGCHDDEGGGGGASEKTDLEQTNQCVNGNE